MSWKRVFRTAVCLLVICCLIVNISPIRADAALVSTSAIVTVSVAPVVAGIIVGLGVRELAVVGGSIALAPIVDSCVLHLQELGLCQEMTIDVFGFTYNGYSVFGIAPKVVDAVRDWLFDSNTLTETEVLTASGFSVDSISTPSAGGSADYFLSSPFFDDVIYDAFYNNSLVVTSCTWGSYTVDDYFISGYYWDVNGTLRWGKFSNALGQNHASVLGAFPLSNYPTQYYDQSAFGPSYSVYMNKSLAESSPGFLYSDCYAVDWNSWSEGDGVHDPSWVPLFHKKSTDAVWSNEIVYFRLRNWCSGLCKNSQSSKNPHYYPSSADSIIWDTGSTTVVFAPDGLQVEQVAPSSQSLEEGYSVWFDNSSSVRDPVTKENVSVLPIPPLNTLQDIAGLTQQQIWNGTTSGDGSSSPPVSDTTGTLAQTGLQSFLNALQEIITAPFRWLWQQIQNLFVPSEDFLTDKVDSLCERFSFADSIVRTGQVLFNGLSGISTEPPVIFVDLGASEGPYDLGGKVAFVDLHWYSRYKPTVDTIISSFLWACFVWRLLIKLPGIINGASGSISIVSGSGSKEDL